MAHINAAAFKKGSRIMTPAPQARRSLHKTLAAATLSAALVIGYAAPALADEAVDAAPTTPDQIDSFEISETRIESDELSGDLTPGEDDTALVSEISPAEDVAPDPATNETVPAPVPAELDPIVDSSAAGAVASSANPLGAAGPASPKYPASGGTKRFIDVPRNHTFYPAITWMYQAGLANGVETAKGIAYKPEGSLTRGAMAAFLYRQAGKPSYTPTKSFIDVPKNHLFADSIGWMRANGLAFGVDTAKGVAYKPSSSLNRGAMAAFLYRQAGSPDFTSAEPFPDVAPTMMFYTPISWMRATGLTVGVDTTQGTLYKPGSNVTRGAMAAFLYREAGKPEYIDSGSLSIATNGGARVSETATAQVSGWSPATLQYSYQWLRNQTPISGATSENYTPDASDQGKHLQVVVSATLEGAAPVSMTSSSLLVGEKRESAQEVEDRILVLVNAERTSRGLPALEASNRYQSRAREWVHAIAGKTESLRHTDDDWWQGTTNLTTGEPWFDDMSFDGVNGEVLAAGTKWDGVSRADQLVNMWMTSDLHRNALLSSCAASGSAGFAYYADFDSAPGAGDGFIGIFVLSNKLDSDGYFDPWPNC